jgi:hypothetical protein
MRGHGLETGKKLDNLGKADLTQAGVLMDVDGGIARGREDHVGAAARWDPASAWT